jgi:hypothetical protein
MKVTRPSSIDLVNAVVRAAHSSAAVGESLGQLDGLLECVDVRQEAGDIPRRSASETSSGSAGAF